MRNDSVFAIRFPSKLMRKLRREARARGVSVAWIVRERVEGTSVIIKPMIGHLTLPATKSARRAIHAGKIRGKRKVPD